MYREYPDREKDQIARGVKELQIEDWNKYLREVERWVDRWR